MKQYSQKRSVGKITLKFLRAMNLGGKYHNNVSGVNLLTASDTALLNETSSLADAVGVTKFITIIIMN